MSLILRWEYHTCDALTRAKEHAIRTQKKIIVDVAEYFPNPTDQYPLGFVKFLFFNKKNDASTRGYLFTVDSHVAVEGLLTFFIYQHLD